MLIELVAQAGGLAAAAAEAGPDGRCSCGSQRSSVQVSVRRLDGCRARRHGAGGRSHRPLYKIEGEVTEGGRVIATGSVTLAEMFKHADAATARVARRRVFQHLRREFSTPRRDAAAIGVGAFIGCLPIYGLHLLLTILVGKVLRLNRLKMYLAANISNPLMAPLLIFTEIQAGAWLRRGAFHALTVDAVRQIDPWSLGGDLVLGSLVIGVLLGAVLALSTLAATNARHRCRR